LPAERFAIESVTAARAADGHPMVLATVHNTGGRVLEVDGTLRLSDNPSGLRAGPFPVTLDAAVPVGGRAQVQVPLGEEVPAGPWLAELTLSSGQFEQSTRTTITFPDRAPASFVGRHTVAGGLLAVLLTAAVLISRRRRRRRRPATGRPSNPGPAPSTRPRRAPACLLAVALLVMGQVVRSSRADAAEAPVWLGSAESFSVLSGAGITNTGATAISADLGASTANAIVGFPPGTIAGHTYIGEPTVPQALADLQLAYNDAAGRSTLNTPIAGDLNGRTFHPGVYHANAALALTGTLTLDADNDPDAVFIFQVGAALDTAASSNINLTNGARPTNVFWQVVGATGIGASATFTGTIMSAGAITIGANATVGGRALSTGGTITLATNTIDTPVPAGGTLSISVPAGSADLGTFANVPGGQTISGQVGLVAVEDTRGGSSSAGWEASVTATAFAPSSGAAIPASSVSYAAGPVSQVRGAVTYLVHDPSDLTTAVAVVTATGPSGDNAASTSWNPAISIVVPSDTLAGIYTATITQSVL
jgi:hypothetical protein